MEPGGHGAGTTSTAAAAAAASTSHTPPDAPKRGGARPWFIHAGHPSCISDLTWCPHLPCSLASVSATHGEPPPDDAAAAVRRRGDRDDEEEGGGDQPDNVVQVWSPQVYKPCPPAASVSRAP